MQEPRWKNGRLWADFRSIDVCIERLPEGFGRGAGAYMDLLQLVGDLRYEGYIESKDNSFQVNLNFDDKLHERVSSGGHDCKSKPPLNSPRGVVGAVGRDADMLLRASDTGDVVVVEIEKANHEKILRDIVKMLLFFEAGQADLAALICPRNYVHSRGVSKVFDIARQVFRVFVRVTELPEARIKRFALIGFTQEVFLGGKWVAWDKMSRRDFQILARKRFEAA